MGVVIADTSGLVAMVRADDATHFAALEAAAALRTENAKIIVPAEVFAETLNILGKKVSNSVAISTGNELLTNPTFQIVASDVDLLAEAVSLLKRQKASDSFVDVLVMAFAARHDTRRIFGFDLIFNRNGFEIPKTYV